MAYASAPLAPVPVTTMSGGRRAWSTPAVQCSAAASFGRLTVSGGSAGALAAIAPAISSASIRSSLLADEVRGLLGDHDRGRVRVAAGDHRHHRRVDHAQALQAVDAQPAVDHGVLAVVAHPA